MRAGDWFTPAAEPEKSCVCSPGYTGKKSLFLYWYFKKKKLLVLLISTFYSRILYCTYLTTLIRQLSSNPSMKHDFLKLFTGENVKPYCFTYHKNECGTMLLQMEEIRSGCIPLFYDWERPKTSCSWFYRCRKLLLNLLIIFTEELFSKTDALYLFVFFS